MANVVTKIKDWRTWTDLALGAFLGGAANIGGNMLLEPQTYNLDSMHGVLSIVKGAIVSGLVSAFLWIRTHPRPDAQDTPAEPPITEQKT